MGFNKVIQMGNLTRDPELTTLPSGDSVVDFSIAINEHYTDKGGQKQERTDYIDCKSYGRTAENINKFFSKGRPIFIEGKLRQEKWVDKQTQQNRSKLIVKVDDWEFVDSKNEANSNNSTSNLKKPFSDEEFEEAGDELEIDGVTV